MSEFVFLLGRCSRIVSERIWIITWYSGRFHLAEAIVRWAKNNEGMIDGLCRRLYFASISLIFEPRSLI